MFTTIWLAPIGHGREQDWQILEIDLDPGIRARFLTPDAALVSRARSAECRLKKIVRCERLEARG